MGRGAARFALERALGRRRAARPAGTLRWSATSAGGIARRLAARGRGSRALLRRRQIHTGPPRFRKADGNRLLGGAGAMLALADVMHLFADEFARLRGRRLALTPVAARSLQCSFLRHAQGVASHVPTRLRVRGADSRAARRRVGKTYAQPALVARADDTLSAPRRQT
jgi:hypothetical protein